MVKYAQILADIVKQSHGLKIRMNAARLFFIMVYFFCYNGGGLNIFKLFTLFLRSFYELLQHSTTQP